MHPPTRPPFLGAPACGSPTDHSAARRAARPPTWGGERQASARLARSGPSSHPLAPPPTPRARTHTHTHTHTHTTECPSPLCLPQNTPHAPTRTPNLARVSAPERRSHPNQSNSPPPPPPLRRLESPPCRTSHVAPPVSTHSPPTHTSLPSDLPFPLTPGSKTGGAAPPAARPPVLFAVALLPLAPPPPGRCLPTPFILAAPSSPLPLICTPPCPCGPRCCARPVWRAAAAGVPSRE